MTMTLTREELFEAIESYWVRRKTGKKGKIMKASVHDGFGLHSRRKIYDDENIEFEVESENQNEEKICQKQP